MQVGSLKAAMAMAGCAPVFALTSQALASTPVLMWRDVNRVSLLCLVVPTMLPERSSVEAMLCEHVRALAAQGAPMPVETIAFGDPAILQGDRVILLVHAAIPTGDSRPRRLLFTIRPYRAAGVENEVLFGATPREVLLDADNKADPALDATIAASLAEILPWKFSKLPSSKKGE